MQCFLCSTDGNKSVKVWWCDAGMRQESIWSERWSGSSWLGWAGSLMCGESELWRSVGMRRSTKAVCSTNNVLCMWLISHQHTQYSIYILSTDEPLNVKLFMLSQPLYSDTEICVRVCVCQTDCFAPSAPSPVVVHYCDLVVMMGSVPPSLPPSRTHT